MHEPTDNAEAFRSGDPAAMEALVVAHQRELTILAQRLMRNAADAEELVQDAFLKAYRSRDSFRGDCSLRTWLYRILTNLCFNRLKRQKREDIVEPGEDEGLEHADQAIGALGSLLDAEQRRHVLAALGDLPPQQKLVLTLRVQHEKSLLEIAAIVQSPLGTVKANLFHAVRNLRKRLAPLFPEEVLPS